MKKIVVGAFIAMVITACGSAKFYTYQVQNIRNTEPGTIYLETTGLGSSENDAYNNAAFNAFNAVLKKGVPGSVQPNPMMENENNANSKEIDNCLHTFNCYNQYVAYSEKVGAPVKTKDGISVDLKIKINLRTLRTYLEQTGAVRKFGL